MRRRVAASLAVSVVTMLVITISPAWAAGGNGESGSDQSAGGELLGDGSAEAWAEDGRDLGSENQSRPGGGDVVCRYYSEATNEQVDLSNLPPELDGVELQVLRLCEDVTTGDYVSIELVTVTPPFGAPADPAALAVMARSRLPLPLPEARMSPDGDQTVNLETWLWVDNWEDQSRSASAGGVTSVVVATPVEQRWTFDSPGEVRTCPNAGTAYDLSKPPSDQSSTCSYTFRRSSAGQPDDAFTVTATLVWHITWTSNIGASGDLGFVSRTVTIPTRVAEHQALNESGGTQQ